MEAVRKAREFTGYILRLMQSYAIWPSVGNDPIHHTKPKQRRSI